MQNREIAKTLIDNPELVLIKIVDGVASDNASVDDLPLVLSGGEYYLATQKHAKACISWINGHDVVSVGERRSRTLDPYLGEWRKTSCFMCDDYTLEVKAKKAKRWIGIYNHNVTSQHFDSVEIAKSFIKKRSEYKNCAPEAWQFIEIEVEVK